MHFLKMLFLFASLSQAQLIYERTQGKVIIGADVFTDFSTGKKYENFDAINVDNTADIPMDYYGIMGVPITFIDKYNPDQFEIIGVGIAKLGLSIGIEPYKPEHKKYRKEVQKCGAVDGDLYMIEDGVVKVPYARILIRRKEQNQ